MAGFCRFNTRDAPSGPLATGLRALFFAVTGIMRLFFYLNYGLAVILVFVGIKMLIADVYKIPVSIALSVVGGILGISIALSLMIPPKKQM